MEIVELHKRGLNISQIAVLKKLSRTRIYQILKSYPQGGLTGLRKADILKPAK